VGVGVRTVRQELCANVRDEAVDLGVGAGVEEKSDSGRRGRRPIGTAERYSEGGRLPIKSAG
jgi:hypothetical protein